jgi:GNAT superfamily N-acetyltransferase
MHNTTESCFELQEALTPEEIEECFSVMHQLRPHLEKQTFVKRVMRQMAEGYRLVYVADGKNVQAVGGFRILEFLAWGKVLYIDDLVTGSEVRRKGCGGKILKWVIEQAKLAGCDQVHLDSGPQRHDAHRLYLNHGFKIIGYHFAKENIHL